MDKIIHGYFYQGKQYTLDKKVNINGQEVRFLLEKEDVDNILVVDSEDNIVVAIISAGEGQGVGYCFVEGGRWEMEN